MVGAPVMVDSFVVGLLKWIPQSLLVVKPWLFWGQWITSTEGGESFGNRQGFFYVVGYGRNSTTWVIIGATAGQRQGEHGLSVCIIRDLEVAGMEFLLLN